MECPECKAIHIRKNGKNRQGKQNYICVTCSRQFIADYDQHRGYDDDVRRECLRMYTNGSGFRAIERVKKVHHTTVIHWVKQVGGLLPDAYEPEAIPEVGELDELETFVGKKTQDLALDSGRAL
jgi:transposase-like protein